MELENVSQPLPFLGHDGLPEGEEHQAVYPQGEELGSSRVCSVLRPLSFLPSPRPLSPSLW